MSDFKVLSYEYLEANKDNNFYEFKKNPEYKGWTLENPSEPEYIGKFISRTTGGNQMNYYFIYKFEKKSLYTGGENPTLNEYVLRAVEEKKMGGKKLVAHEKIRNLGKVRDLREQTVVVNIVSVFYFFYTIAHLKCAMATVTFTHLLETRFIKNQRNNFVKNRNQY